MPSLFSLCRPNRLAFRGVILLVGFLGLHVLAADEQPATQPTVVFKGHTEAVYAIAYSPDGKYVVTASFDKTLRVWDVASGKEIKSFGGAQGHQGLVDAVALSPDGQSFVSGGTDNFARLWDFPGSKPLRDFAHSDAVNAVALTVDGKTLAGAGKDGNIRLYSTADGKQLFELKGHTGPVTGVSFNANGQLLVSSGADKTLRFWDVTKGTPITSYVAHGAGVNAVAIHPNSASAYSVGDDGLLKFWKLPPDLPRTLPAHAEAVTALALSNDGNQVVTGSADKTVRLSNFANGQQVKQWKAGNASVTAVAQAPNNSLVAGADADGRLYLWNPTADAVLTQGQAHTGAVTGLAFHPSSTQLLTVGADGLLKVWAMPPVPGKTLAHPEGVNAAVLSADGKKLYTASNDKVVRAWNLAAPAQPERQFPGHTAAATAVAISPNGQLLASGGADETIRFWNQTNGQQTDLLGAHSGPIVSLVFSPSGQQLLSASEDGSVKVWSLPLVAPKMLAHADQVTSVAVSADGTKLLTGCADKSVRVWNLATAAAERALPGGMLAVTSVSSSGTTFAAGNADKSLTVWNAADGKELKKIANLSGAVNSVSLSPDAKFVVAGLADNSVRVFAVADGKETKALTGHTGAVSAVAYTPKGDQVVTASADKTVQVWNIADGKSVQKLERTAPVTCLALNKDGTKIAAGGGDKTVTVWTAADGKTAATITTPAIVNGVSFSPDGTKLVIAGADNRARVYTLDGKLAEQFTHAGPVNAAAFHPDGKRIISAGADKSAQVWQSALLWQGQHGGAVRQAIYSPKGDQVISAGDDKSVNLWNAADGKPMRTIAAHTSPVTAVAVSADSTKLISAGADKTVNVWTLTPPKPEEKPLATIPLSGVPQALTISPNGTRIAVGLGDDKTGQIRVFDLVSGKEVQVIAEHGGPIRSLAFAADNRTIISASTDKTARIADVGVVAMFDAHTGGASSVAFHSSGTQAITGGADKTVKHWDLSTGKVLKTFGPLPDAVTGVAFNRDFTQVGASAGKTVKVWNLADGKELLTLNHPAVVSSLSFNVDKTRIVTGAADNLARVWDVATGKELQAFAHAGPVTGVVFHGNNTNLVTASADKTAVVQTVSAVRVVAASEQPLRSVMVSPLQTQILTAGDDKNVVLWNITTGAKERTLDGATGSVSAVTMTKNGALIAAAGADGTVRIYTNADGKMISQIKAPAAVRGLAFTPNNLALAGACSDKSIVVWNCAFNPGQPVPADFGKPLQQFAHDGGAFDVLFAADNATFYTAGGDKTAKAWKFAAEAPTRNFQHPREVDAVAFDPKGLQLATGAHDGNLRIWDVAKGNIVKEVKAHPPTMANPNETFPVYCVAWNTAGTQIVTGSRDNSLKIWDAAAGTLVKDLKAYKEKEADKGHRDPVFCAAFSPDGKTIASGSAGTERVIKLWDANTGTVIRDFVNPNIKPPPGGNPQSHPGWVYGVRFTSDGKYLVSVGGAPKNKGYIAIWNVADGKLVYGEEMAMGTFYGVAIAPDGKSIAVAAGSTGGALTEANHCYIFKMPEAVK
jgi:WD40 repeat protein